MTCAVYGCTKPKRKRDWCAMHYMRWRTHGDTSCTKKAANGAGYVQGGYFGHQINGKRTFVHVVIAERALGHSLPMGAVVHHVNENRLDNRKENLVICPSRAYHNLLHARMRAQEACGNPNWRRCRRCKSYDQLKNLRVYQNQNTTAYWHPSCEARYNKNKRRER